MLRETNRKWKEGRDREGEGQWERKQRERERTERKSDLANKA